MGIATAGKDGWTWFICTVSSISLFFDPMGEFGKLPHANAARCSPNDPAMAQPMNEVETFSDMTIQLQVLRASSGV